MKRFVLVIVLGALACWEFPGRPLASGLSSSTAKSWARRSSLSRPASPASPFPTGYYWLNTQTGLWGTPGTRRPGYISDGCYQQARRPACQRRRMLQPVRLGQVTRSTPSRRDSSCYAPGGGRSS